MTAAPRTPLNPAPSLDLPDLTLPVGSARTLRRLTAAFLQHTWRLWQQLPLAALTPGNRALYPRIVQQMQALQRRDPSLPLQLLRTPTISTLIHCLHKQLRPGGDAAALNRWLREACALLALEMAAAELLQAPVELSAADLPLPVLLSPALNLRLQPAPAAQRLILGNGQLQLTGEGPTLHLSFGELAEFQHPLAAIDRPYHLIAPGLYLALADNNPLAQFEAHPDKDGNQLDLGGQPVERWLEALRWSLQLVETHLPLLAEEIRLLLRLVVPVGWHQEKHLSASYQEAVGLIYLTLHPQPMTMAEALVHEFQHNKINAAFHLDPLLQNAWFPLVKSPVRPDMRPLHGVVLAVHAFQPVAELYAQMLGQGHPLAANAFWRERFSRIIELDRQGAATVLANAVPTPIGAPLFAEMARLDQHLAELRELHFAAQAPTGGDFDELAGHD